MTVLEFGKIGYWVVLKFKYFGFFVIGIRGQKVSELEYFESRESVVTKDCLGNILSEAGQLILTLPGENETEGIFIRE